MLSPFSRYRMHSKGEDILRRDAGAVIHRDMVGEILAPKNPYIQWRHQTGCDFSPDGNV